MGETATILEWGRTTDQMMPGKVISRYLDMSSPALGIAVGHLCAKEVEQLLLSSC